MRRTLSALKPLFFMLLLGYLALLVFSYVIPEEKPVITLTPPQIQNRFNLTTPSTWLEKSQQVQIAIDEQVVFNEAITMGLLETKAAQERIKKITALTEDTYNKNYQQVIIHSDPLLKNYLTITLENIIKESFPLEAISDDEINAWIETNPQPENLQLTLSHVFINGFSTSEENTALALYKKIISDNISPETAITLGDVFYGAKTFTRISLSDLSDYLGNTTLLNIKNLTANTWLKPMRSAYGWHIFYIDTVSTSKLNHAMLSKKAIASIQQKQVQKKWQAWLDIKRQLYNYHIILPEQWSKKITISAAGVVKCTDC